MVIEKNGIFCGILQKYNVQHYHLDDQTFYTLQKTFDHPYSQVTFPKTCHPMSEHPVQPLNW